MDKIKNLFIGACYALVLPLSCVIAQARGATAGGAAAPVALGIPDTTDNNVRDTVYIDEVEINTGYQRIPKERATGSFVFVDSALLNRSFSTDILSRLEGVVPGLIFHRDPYNPNQTDIAIRGASTIQAANQPLIILDNFEYQGDLNNINPNDVANISILKDAAAASIWGAKAGNGVIVITTKAGRYGQRTQLSVSSNLAIKNRQNLFGMPSLPSTDYIDLEIELFKRGRYNNLLSNINKPPVSPVVVLLDQQRNGELSEQETVNAINSYREADMRRDLTRYFYRRSIIQQYAVSLSGGGQNNRYYASVGWDDQRSGTVGAANKRLSLTLNHTMGLFSNRLEINTGLMYTNNTGIHNDLPITGVTHPYTRLADDNGTALSLARYNPGFTDTVGHGRLLDWLYRPLDEIGLADNRENLADLRANLNINLRATEWLRLNASYQFANGVRNNRDYHSQETFFTRDLINQFTSIAANGSVLRAVPLGGILDTRNNTYTSHLGRAQVDVQQTWHDHTVQALVGGEISDNQSLANGGRYYGYSKENLGNIPVDAQSPHVSMVTGYRNIRISDAKTLAHHTTRFISLYSNASYGYRNTYWLSASIRRDGSNLFGVKANQKWSPLWSAGLKWDIHRERFFNPQWLPQLSLRLTYGTSGNIDRSVSAYLQAQTFLINTYGRPTMLVAAPPNPNLTWETVATLNTAVDFALFPSRRITGSFAYYRKNGRNLIGPAELPTVTGLTSYTGNTAAISGHGVDLQLTSHNLNGALQWQTDFFYSTNQNRVTEYRVTPANNSSYIAGAKRVGKPLEALFAYRWGGLNPENGNPIGFLHGKPSEDYPALSSSTDESAIVYIGSGEPTYFGALRNTFTWKGFSLSFNLTFKLGYHFQEELLDYTRLFNGGYQRGAAHFDQRWQKPGDERTTDVPSMVYPEVAARDRLYTQSEVAFQRGDHVRLQDIRLGYRMAGKRLKPLPFTDVQVFVMATNAGLLWKATAINTDPDFGYTNRQPLLSAGLKLNL